MHTSKSLTLIQPNEAEPIEKEPEMQIGYPTDVKHVAHIGCDGPLVSSPAWVLSQTHTMNHANICILIENKK